MHVQTNARLAHLTAALSSAALLSAALLCACGGPEATQLDLEVAQPERAQGIVGGDECDATLQPSAVAIILDTVVTSPGRGNAQIRAPRCTGTLIAPDVVLTAAHCVDDTLLLQQGLQILSEEYYISFEPDLRAMYEASQDAEVESLPDDAVRAVDWIMHPGFDIFSLQSEGVHQNDDIALIFLEAPVSVRPEVVITAPEQAQVTSGVAVEIAGWGRQTAQASSSPAPIGTAGEKLCANTSIYELGTHEVSLGDPFLGEAVKCHGDSGGPAYIVVDTDHLLRRRVFSVASHLTGGTGTCGGPVAETLIDPYRGWLDAQMATRCQNGLRSWCDEPGLIPPGFYDNGWQAPDGQPVPVYADLDVRVRSGPSRIVVDEIDEVEIRIKNEGEVETQGDLELLVELDFGLDLEGYSASGLSCDETVDGLLCRANDTLYPEQGLTLTLDLSPDDEETYDAQVTVWVPNELDPSNNALTFELEGVPAGTVIDDEDDDDDDDEEEERQRPDPGAPRPLLESCACVSVAQAGPLSGLLGFALLLGLATRGCSRSRCSLRG